MTENLPAATVQADVISTFGTSSGFALLQRQAQMLANSFMVPEAFSIFNKDRKLKNADEQRYAVANAVIAMEMAMRIGASPLMVAQNLVPIHGRPTWSSQFVIACINASGKFSPLRFDVSGDGDARQCIAWAFDLATRDRLEGPPVSIAMAKKEGWYQKNGSKWQSLPELMLRYRAAAFFGRLYAPDLLMGMRSVDEAYDVGDDVIDIKPEPTDNKIADINAEIKAARKATPKEKTEKAPESPIIDDQAATKGNVQAEQQNASTSHPEQQEQEKPVAGESAEIPTTAETQQADTQSGQAAAEPAAGAGTRKPADVVASFKAEIDACKTFVEAFAWTKANEGRLNTHLATEADRKEVIGYAIWKDHMLSIDDHKTPESVNEWAELTLPGLPKILENHHQPSAAALYKKVQEKAAAKVMELRKAAGEPATDATESNQAPPARSKEFYKLIEQLQTKGSSIVLDKWLFAIQMKVANLEDDEQKAFHAEVDRYRNDLLYIERQDPKA